MKLVKISLQRRDLLRSSTSNLHLLNRYSDRFRMLWLFNAMFLVLTWLSLKQKHFEIFLDLSGACFWSRVHLQLSYSVQIKLFVVLKSGDC